MTELRSLAKCILAVHADDYQDMYRKCRAASPVGRDLGVELQAGMRHGYHSPTTYYSPDSCLVMMAARYF